MSSPLFDGLPPIAADDAHVGQRIRVALPVPLDQVFDYLVPKHASEPFAEATLEPGIRVVVPFAGQSLTGVIVPDDLIEAEGSDDAQAAGRALLEIESVIDEEPVVSDTLMRVLAAAAAELFAPIGLALGHALPPGSTPRTARPWALTSRGERALEQGARRRGLIQHASSSILERLSARPFTAHALARSLPGVDMSTELARLASDGLIERRTERRGPSARIPMERFVRLAQGIDLEATCAGPLARAKKQAALLREVAQAPRGLATRALTSRDAGARALLRALKARDLIVVEERPRLEATDTILDGDEVVRPTEDQSASLVPICDAIKRQVCETFLLHGVTGSGKTEVYLRALAEALAAGRQALVLVPEISLTHQIVARLRARFGDQVAVLHSGLKPGQRLAQWERLRSGDTTIAVGARSALFAPLENLGLVVIDEEHDSAYKNEEGFRYHARDLAARRAEAASCPLVLGSATPSLETRHRADRGEIARLSLPRRVGGRPLPAVEIVDLGREREKNPRGRKLILSRSLRQAISQTFEDGGQTILFLNRRGFSTRIFCFQCGHAERCDDCDVALVFHAAEYRLRCHYCDLVRAVPEHCNGCGDPETALLGVGTERLEEEVGSLFPSARTLRLDRDTAAKRGHTERVLCALRDREVDIVIGTQMVAKGHDFPGVGLVGVVAADIGLHLPDFRAAERTFQLLTQVAGRAGRANRPGRVVVQTFVPDHYAIAPVSTHDFEGFYAEEITHRAALGYPPFGLLSRLVIHSEEETVAQETAAALAREARLEVREGEAVEILGPAPAPIARLRGRHRLMLLLKGSDEAALRRVTARLAARMRKLPREVQVALDVRPVSML